MNKQWVVLVTMTDGRTSIAGVETRVAEHHHILDDEQVAEGFAGVCRSTVPGIYSAQVVNVEYEKPEVDEI